MLKINNEPPKGKCPKCTHYQKQIVRLKKAFIEEDDENVRRSMKYEDKILKLKAAIKRSKSEYNSEKSKQEKVLEAAERPVSNTQDRHLG